MICPSISSKYYYTRFGFKEHFLCELMNTKPENRFSKIFYQISAIIFALTHFLLLINISHLNVSLSFLFLCVVCFSVLFIGQVLIHGQDSLEKLKIHSALLLLSFITQIMIHSYLLLNYPNWFSVLLILSVSFNIVLIIFNSFKQNGKKIPFLIVFGKYVYMLLIISSLFLFYLF